MVPPVGRIREYKAKWKELTDIYGNLCFYCKKEIANTIDHVVPYGYDHDGDLDNLVPACLLCNAIASNKHFPDVETKRQYILNRRKSRQNRIVICTVCLLPFAYREHSPSLFLCAECYDAEYGTKKSCKAGWLSWIALLYSAGIPAQAHRNLTKRLKNVHDVKPKERLEVLVDEYAYYASSDEKFAELLVRA